MRRALFRQAVADVRSRPLPSVLLVLVVVAATVGIVAGLGQRSSLAERWDDAFHRANGAHVALFGDNEALRRAAADRDVVESAGPVPYVRAATLSTGTDRVEDVDARGGDLFPAVGRPLLMAGRWLTAGVGDEIVVERSLALDAGIEVGDRLTVAGPAGGQVAGRVVGVALDLLDCAYPTCDSATVWMADSTLASLHRADDRIGALLLVRIAEPMDVGAFQQRMQHDLGPGLAHVLDWRNTRHDALIINQFFGAFLAVFGTFLLLSAALVLASTVSGRVVDGTREIGLLKAVGYTPRAITALLLLQHLALAAVGVAIGTTIGTALTPSLELDLGKVLGGGGASVSPTTVGLALAVVGVTVAAATIGPAWRAGWVPASRAIAIGAGTPSRRPSRLARLATRLRLGPPVAVGLKDAGARPLRTWLAVGALALTASSLIVTLTFDRTADRVTADAALLGDPYDVEVIPTTMSDAEAVALLDGEPRVAGWFTATQRRAAVGAETFQLRALGGDVPGAGFAVREGRWLEGPAEAVAGYGLLERLGIGIGDRVRVEVGGGVLDVTVVGWYSEVEDTGEILQVTLDALRQVEPDARDGVYLAHAAAGVDPEALASELGSRVGEAAVVEPVDAAVDEFDAFTVAFGIFTLVSLGVGLANLLATVLLRARERTRDAGILKSLGFTPGQIVVVFAVGAGALALVATLIGVPLGVVVAEWMMDLVGAEAGFGPGLGARLDIGTLATTGVGIVVAATVLGALGSRRAARVQVAAVVRAE